MNVQCPSCGVMYPDVKNEAAGRRANCKKCGVAFVVRAAVDPLPLPQAVEQPPMIVYTVPPPAPVVVPQQVFNFNEDSPVRVTRSYRRTEYANTTNPVGTFARAFGGAAGAMLGIFFAIALVCGGVLTVGVLMSKPVKGAEIDFTRKKYVFKIRTKDGHVISNVLVEGRSQPDAEMRLRKRYPDCTILDVQVKE